MSQRLTLKTLDSRLQDVESKLKTIDTNDFLLSQGYTNLVDSHRRLEKSQNELADRLEKVTDELSDKLQKVTDKLSTNIEILTESQNKLTGKLEIITDKLDRLTESQQQLIESVIDLVNNRK